MTKELDAKMAKIIKTVGYPSMIPALKQAMFESLEHLDGYDGVLAHEDEHGVEYTSHGNAVLIQDIKDKWRV